ncbi:hypothetical protein OQB17_004421 [Salmonella enterica]|nr:hypothetical protein [Salmonella enterica]
MVIYFDVTNTKNPKTSDISIFNACEDNKRISIENDDIQQINLMEVMENASDELADIISTFGKFGKNSKSKTNSEDESDYLSIVMDENCDEKLGVLIQNFPKLNGGKEQIINYARQLFPDYIDLIMIFREMLLSKKLSLLQKKNFRRLSLN